MLLNCPLVFCNQEKNWEYEEESNVAGIISYNDMELRCKMSCPGFLHIIYLWLNLHDYWLMKCICVLLKKGLSKSENKFPQNGQKYPPVTEKLLSVL